MPTDTSIISALLMVVGMVGIVVPVLPGLLLVLAGPIVWAGFHPDHHTWLVVAVAAVAYLAGLVVKYLVPGRDLKRAGVSNLTLALAIVLAIVGFFVIPVVGALIGFIGGIVLVELGRTRDVALAWRRTRRALVAILKSIGVELVTGFAIITTWLVGLALLGQGP